jgi:transcriptional regulator with XRE-family HTH domain
MNNDYGYHKQYYIYVETHSPAYRIKKSRIDKNLSLKELSSLSNISYNYITALESGRYKPNFRVLNKLSQVLDKSIFYLGCFEDMPQETCKDKFRKPRYYNGDTRKNVVAKLGLNEHAIKDWEEKEFNHLNKCVEKIENYMEILYKQI